MGNHAVPVLLLGVILSLFISPNLSAVEKEQEKNSQGTKLVIIPEKVKRIFEEGMATRLVQPDIPFTIDKHLYFPAGSNLYTIFLFRVKNAELGFSPIEGSPEEKKDVEETLAEEESAPAKLQARAYLFLQFNKLENDTPGEVAYEVYVPIDLQEDSSTYEPEKVDYYSTGYLLAPGNYLLSMAISSQDLEKIGTQYLELSLPDPSSLPGRLETTPLFFVKHQEYMDSPEKRPTAHKDLFTYSILKIEPNFEKVFSSGDNLELLFFVFGAQSTEDGQFDIEVTYSILKDDENVISFAPGHYKTPFIHQPLPLKKTTVTKSESGEKTEMKDIEAGKYALSMKILDKVSGKSITKSIDFQVK
jgi:hypothetical protein